MSDISFQLKKCVQEIPFTLVEGKDNCFLTSDVPNIADILLSTDEAERTFVMSQSDIESLDESDGVIAERLANLYRVWIEKQNIGLDTDSYSSAINEGEIKYSHNDIYIENKPFSIWQIVDYIDKQILNVSPDFQRNFIWDKGRQSRLIESILLGLPLPAIYLTQFEDGSLAVVDGLQRISTIYSFMSNKLRLCHLEYLKECEGCTYKELENKLPPLVFRMFDQTSMICFVIDRRSPSQLKYDLFKRLNTGGMPLNNQEIRNCLSKKSLQQVLKRMVESQAFLVATDKSINNYRMDAQEMALRFMYFYDEYSTENVIGTYVGNLDIVLNKKVEELNRISDYTLYESAFELALTRAYSLFGEYTFRKRLPGDSGRRRINKSIFVAITVILARDGEKYKYDMNLVEEFTKLLGEDMKLFNAVTWSTTSSINTEYVMRSFQKLFDTNILL